MHTKHLLIPILVTLTGMTATCAQAGKTDNRDGEATQFPTVALVTPAQAKTASDCSFSEMMGRNEGFSSLQVNQMPSSEKAEQAVDADLPDWLKE